MTFFENMKLLVGCIHIFYFKYYLLAYNFVIFIILLDSIRSLKKKDDHVAHLNHFFNLRVCLSICLPVFHRAVASKSLVLYQ